jgi:hypothetical protein
MLAGRARACENAVASKEEGPKALDNSTRANLPNVPDARNHWGGAGTIRLNVLPVSCYLTFGPAGRLGEACPGTGLKLLLLRV